MTGSNFYPFTELKLIIVLLSHYSMRSCRYVCFGAAGTNKVSSREARAKDETDASGTVRCGGPAADR